MKISFAITVCNELNEIKKLIPFLLEHKRIQDEIVILYDEKNGNSEVLEFLLPYNILPNVQTWRGFDWNNNFADWKNKLNSYCSGDYIFQLDADEMISEYMVKNINQILEMNPDVDLIFVPRINTVDGLTQEHINKWGWKLSTIESHVNEKIIDTESDEYKLLKNGGFIIEETEI
jgi:glycosyltransferase involved in cell wall biosynthesis